MIIFFLLKQAWLSNLAHEVNTAIQGQRSAVDVGAGLARQENTSPGHVSRQAHPAQGVGGLDLVAERFEGVRHHFGRERAARERVGGYAAGAEVHGQVPGEVVQAGLGGGVGKGREEGHAEGIDGAYVDHPRGVLGGRGGFEEGGELLGQGEDALEVEGQEFGPSVMSKSVLPAP